MKRFFWGALRLIVASVFVGLAMACGPAGSPRVDAISQEQETMRAEITPEGAVRVWLEGAAAPSLADFALERADGAVMTLASIAPAPVDPLLPDPGDMLLTPPAPLRFDEAYWLEFRPSGARTRVRLDGWFRTLASDKPLGAEIAADGASTRFAVFSPRATKIELFLFDGPDDAADAARARIAMTRDSDGVWEAQVPGDLHGVYYDFRVFGPKAPGSRFFETHPTQISDPYARVQNEAQGKSRVWRKGRPAMPLPKGRPAMADVVAYEVHVQDFADLLPVAADLQGTLAGMAQGGLRNTRGEKVGLDAIADLGVNVLHLMPVQEFLHYPDADWRAAFADDPDMQAMGVAAENYQWGYRTTHAFAVENRYRRKGSALGQERADFRALVEACHQRGMAVIIDLVPNHTGENMDGRDDVFNFNALDREYYYRTDENGDHIGPFGNEVKTEDRPMTRRWLIDQAKHWIEEFGIDGFRIDLAGQIDRESLLALRAAVGPDIIIYGEPWIAPSDPRIAADPRWSWYKHNAPISFFQDETRDALVGSPFRLEDPATDRGFAGGNASLRAKAMAAIANDFDDERGDTTLGVNYLDIHDNWTLADRFAIADWNGLNGVDEAAYRIAAGMLLTSLGPIVLHGGSEMLRSKGLAPVGEQEKAVAGGKIYLKGRHDTYNLRAPNRFVWEELGARPADGPAFHQRDIAAMRAWWKGLIDLRASAAGAVLRVAQPAPGHVRFATPDNPALLGYVIGAGLAVAVNVGAKPGEIDLPFEQRNWRRIADGTRIDRDGVDAGPVLAVAGGLRVAAPAKTLQIWVREE